MTMNCLLLEGIILLEVKIARAAGALEYMAPPIAAIPNPKIPIGPTGSWNTTAATATLKIRLPTFKRE